MARRLRSGLTADDVDEWPDRIRAVAAEAVKQVATDDIDQTRSRYRLL